MTASLPTEQLPATELPAGCTLVMTKPLRTLLYAAPVAMANRRIIVLDGQTGSGKTTALQVMADKAEQRVVTVTLSDDLTARMVIEKIYTTLEGLTFPLQREHRRSELMAHLRRLLTDADVILMVDEAQKAPFAALELVRTLHEHTALKFGLVLAGVNLRRKLAREPMLLSRVGLRVPFEYPREHDLTAFLAKTHPVLAHLIQTIPDAVMACDDLLCQGDLRKWTEVLEWVLSATNGGATPADVTHLQAAIEFITGDVVRLPT